MMIVPTLRFPHKPPSSVVAARNWHWQYVADNLRPDEQAHWLALTGFSHYVPDDAAKAWMNSPSIKMAIIGKNGYPLVAGGSILVRPGSIDLWMCGTPEGWKTGWREITKGVRWFMGQQFKAGARRLQIVTLQSRTEACQWYKDALGMQLEGTHPKAGANGETLVTYSRVVGGSP